MKAISNTPIAVYDESAFTYQEAGGCAQLAGSPPKPFSHGEKEGPAPPGPRRLRGPPGAGSEAWEDEGVRGRQEIPSPSQPLRGRAPPSPSGRGVSWTTLRDV